jgi:putative hydrolase of the HAD superfamily
LIDIRAITIDLDDTLWEIHPVIHRAEQRLRDWLDTFFPRTTAMFSPADARELRRQVVHEHPGRSHDLTFVRRTVLARMGVAAGYTDALVDDAMEIFDAARNTVELFPEVRPALQSLRRDYVLVAVTNGNADLGRIGISDLFHEFVSARTAGAAKPARQIFDVAVRAGGATAEQTLHVGDHPEADVQGAHAAGLKTVWVNRNGDDWPPGLAPPHAVVDHVGQLAALLGARRR